MKSVGFGADLGYSLVAFNLGPVVNLGGDGSRLEFELRDVGVSNTEVGLGKDVDVAFTDEGHLELVVLNTFVLLGEL